jgi:hypothetical protein
VVFGLAATHGLSSAWHTLSKNGIDRWGSGHTAEAWGGSSQCGLHCSSGPAQFSLSKTNLFQYFNYSKLAKIQKLYLMFSKFFKLYHVVDNFKRKNFPFGKKFKLPTKVELKFQGLKCI